MCMQVFYCIFISVCYLWYDILLLFNLSVIIMDIKNYSKETEGVKLHLILRYNSWFDDFKAIFFAHSYPYSVVYTDGLISQDKNDGIGRVPFGIVVKGIIIRIDAPKEKMTLLEASKLLEEDCFAELKAYLPTFKALKHIRSNLSTINNLIKQLGGTEFVGGWYASCTHYCERYIDDEHKFVRNFEGDKVKTIHMNMRSNLGEGYALPSDKFYVRICYLI